MKIVLFALLAVSGLSLPAPIAQAAPYLIVTVTGSGGGPPTFNGLAGLGLLQFRKVNAPGSVLAARP